MKIWDSICQKQVQTCEDAMVIPKNAKNPELAHEFINFVSSYEGAMDNSSEVGYTSPK